MAKWVEIKETTIFMCDHCHEEWAEEKDSQTRSRWELIRKIRGDAVVTYHYCNSICAEKALVSRVLRI